MPEVPWINEDELAYLCSYQCILCGVRLIQIHHINGDSNDNDPDNWAILCQPHHDLANRDLQVIGTHTRKFTQKLIKDQRKRHIESCLFSRFGISIMNTPVEIDAELGVPSEKLEGNPKGLLERTIKWLSGR